MKKRHLHIALAAIYRHQHDDQIEFLVIRRVPEDGGFWQPITGKIEAGETPRQAALREVAEETGLAELLHMSELLRLSRWEGEDTIGQDYLHVAEAALHHEVQLSDEHDDYRWLSLEEASALLKYEGNRKALQEAYNYAVRKKIANL